MAGTEWVMMVPRNSRGNGAAGYLRACRACIDHEGVPFGDHADADTGDPLLPIRLADGAAPFAMLMPPWTTWAMPRRASSQASRRMVMSETPNERASSETGAKPCWLTRSKISA